MVRALGAGPLIVPVFCLLLVSGLAPSSPAQTDMFGCGPEKQKFNITIHKGQHPMPEPPPGKAVVYVFRAKKYPDSARRFSLRTLLSVNGKWVGVNRFQTYFYFEADPGLLRLCSKLEKRPPVFMNLTVEAGKSYYIRQWVVFFDHEITQVPEQEARRLLAKCDYAAFKGKP